MRMEAWRDTLTRDLRYAARQLRRSPVFTTVAVLTLALGIGANTAIFSVVDGILFRPLPFPEPHELVNVWTDVTRRGGPADEWLSYANFADLREGAETLEEAAAWGGWAPTWTDPERPEQLRGARITRGMFSGVLRVEPRLGSGLRPSDDEPGAAPRVLLSDGFWRRAFGGDPAAVGRTLTLDGASMEIAGVMPAGFRPPFVPDADLWIAARVDPAEQATRRGGFSWRAVARVSEGRDPAAADAELRRLGSRLEASHPESNTGLTFRAVPLREDLTARARSGLLVLLGAVGLVLLVACVNVANLLLARATGRTSEMAVRQALGAGRSRLASQLLTESAVLAAVGGIAAVAVAFLATDLLVSLAPETTPRLDEVGVDGRVLAFTALVTLLAGGLFGLTPALRAARSDPRQALQEGGRGGLGGTAARLRGLLVSAQVALALVLLVGAGLLARSFDSLRSVELGFEPAGVTTFQVFLRGYESPERVAFARAMEERLAALPGVAAVGVTGTLPLSGFDGDASFHVEGRPLPEPGGEPAAWIRRVTPGYLPAMEIEVVRGRGFGDVDVEGDRGVVIVNETLAARWFPGEDPVGRRITFSDPAAEDPFWREIVGVARDIRNFGIREESRMAVYLPWAQAPGFAVNGVVRTEVPDDGLVPALRAHVDELDPTVAVARIRPMTELVERALAPERFLTLLLSLFAAAGLTLAAVGLYGVVSWSVGRRVRELGVRMALGAGTARVAAMVVRGSLVLVAAGVVAGLGAVLLLTRLLDGLLYGVEATDPATLAAVVLLLVAVATVAAAVPAVRAAAVDPARALHGE
jgi:putative ABC transport system permease protein